MDFRNLNEISEIIMGQSPSSDSYNNENLGIPFFQGKSEFGTLNPIVKMYCTEPKKIAKPSDILMSVRAPVGDVNIANIECCIGRGLCAIRSKANVNHKYLYYFLLTQKEYLENKSTGSTFKAINKNTVSELLVPIMELDKQKKIVEILDIAQELIDKRKKQIEELDLLVKSKFIEMFGDPVINKKGWKVRELLEVATLLNGRAYKQDELLDEGKTPVLRVGNFFSNRNWFYSDLELEEEKYCYNGDLLYAWSASFGPKIWDGDRVIYHYHIWKLVVDENKINKIYLYWILNILTDFFKSNTHGATMLHLTKVGMEKNKIILPSLDLQNQFAGLVKKVDKLKFEMEKSLKELEDNFNSLMQKAFKGELFQ